MTSWSSERLDRIDRFLRENPKLHRRAPEAIDFLLDERQILLDEIESFPIPDR